MSVPGISTFAAGVGRPQFFERFAAGPFVIWKQTLQARLTVELDVFPARVAGDRSLVDTGADSEADAVVHGPADLPLSRRDFKR
ncbi:MAG: hypothetical protein QM770_07295 [Tepidisphaeraceae bacterium]